MKIRQPRAVKASLLFALLITVGISAAACGGTATPSAQPEQSIITIYGPSELMPVVREVTDSYTAGRRNVQVSTVIVSATEALAALRRGEASLAVVASSAGLEQAAWLQTELARQPILVIVHPDNAVGALSLEKLGDIYSGRAGDWNQVGWTLTPILPLSRENGASTRLRVDAAFIGSNGRLHANALILPSDEAMVATVSRRPEAIGYIAGLNAPAGVKALVVEGQSAAAIARGGAYPLWQPIILVTKQQPPALVQDLLTYAKGRQGQRIVASWGYGQGGAK